MGGLRGLTGLKCARKGCQKLFRNGANCEKLAKNSRNLRVAPQNQKFVKKLADMFCVHTIIHAETMIRFATA